MSEATEGGHAFIGEVFGDQAEEERDCQAGFVPIIAASSLLLVRCLIENCQHLDFVAGGFHDLGTLEGSEGTEAIAEKSVGTGRLNLLDCGMVGGDHFVQSGEERLTLEATSTDGVDGTVREVSTEVHEDEDLAGARVEEEQRGLGAIGLENNDWIVGLRLHIVEGES